ncbi:hypothetical protein AB6A23_08740 [Paenibacillus tarimensis]
MPLPMVHLAIAVKYFEDQCIPNSFFLGSIAPDSIHMRNNASRDDKSRTHFGGQQTDPILLENYYKEYISQKIDSDWRWFVKGYFAHVLTDYYWVKSVYHRFKEEALENKLTNEGIRTKYYLETDEVDFFLYETKEWKHKVWNGLVHTKIYSIDPLLNEEEINFWRLRTIHWFDLITSKPGIEPQYITKLLVEEFIEQTAEKVRTTIDDWDIKLFEEVSNIS